MKNKTNGKRHWLLLLLFCFKSILFFGLLHTLNVAAFNKQRPGIQPTQKNASQTVAIPGKIFLCLCEQISTDTAFFDGLLIYVYAE